MANDPLETLRQNAQAALSRGQHQEARQIYQQALGYNSDSPDIHYGIATVCFLLGDLHSAVYHFKEVIRLDPLRAGAFINLGAVQNRLGLFEESLATLRRGIQLDPNRAEGYYNLALVYKQLGQLEMAINAYREALRLNARMYDAHYNLGNIFLEKGQLHLAIAHYKQALELRPNWEKGRIALEAALADQAAQESSGATKAPVTPAVAPAPDSKLDPDRVLDPTFHGNYLRELHDIVIDTDKHSQAMLEFLQKEVEEVIRVLSICILTPKDPKYNLDDQIKRFDAAVLQLQQLQEAMQKRMTRAKMLGEQIIKI
jgi:tetratricopeptide (TPR) repeat protein